MHDEPTPPVDLPSPLRPPLPRSLRFRKIGILLGLVLLAAAVIAVARQHEAFRAAVHSITQLPPGRLTSGVAVLIGSLILNVILSGVLFSLLISPYGRVGRIEMQALIAATALLNYLPVPGFLGRIAYHKTVNGIAVKDSAKTVFQAMALSFGVALYLALAVWLTSTGSVNLGVFILTPIPPLAAAMAFMKGRRVLLAAALVRYVEILVAAVRYHAAFALIGSPIDATGALAFACISAIATMVPFLSNGMGLREWAVGLASPLLTSYHVELGITADLLNRAAEMIVFTLLGLAGILYLARMRRTASVRNHSARPDQSLS